MKMVQHGGGDVAPPSNMMLGGGAACHNVCNRHKILLSRAIHIQAPAYPAFFLCACPGCSCKPADVQLEQRNASIIMSSQLAQTEHISKGAVEPFHWKAWPLHCQQSMISMQAAQAESPQPGATFHAWDLCGRVSQGLPRQHWQATGRLAGL